MIKSVCLALNLLFAIGVAYSTELPDYQIVLNAQLKCDDSELSKIPWDKRYSAIWKLAHKTVSILSDVQLSEEIRVQKKKIGRHRDFKLQYVPYGRIICGEESEIEANPKLVVEYPVTTEASKLPGHFDIYDNDPVHHEVTYLAYMKYTDQPNPPGMDGMSCLVDLKAFLDNPLKAIDINKLCKGEKKSKIEFTKKEILRVAEIFKKQTSATKTDKKK